VIAFTFCERPKVSTMNHPRLSMVADPAQFPSPPLAGAPSPAAQANAIVALDAGAPHATLPALATALLEDETLVNVASASRRQHELVAQLLPPARLTIDERPELKRRRPLPAMAQHFANAGAEQERLHQELRDRLLVPGAPSPLPQGLPEPRNAGVVALVLVRCEPAMCARAMTTQNLNHVMAALASVARRTRNRRDRVSHALIYGRLAPELEAQLKRRFGDELTLSWMPYRFLDDGRRDMRALPSDAAVLASLVALQRRYRDGLVAIGFRGDTLDAAALLGIPSLYFDETTDAHWPHCYADGRYLIDARRDGDVYERHLHLTRAINTFVRINMRSGPGQRDRHQLLRLDASALADLMTALRVWLPRGIGAQRNWSQRASLSRFGLLRPWFESVREQCCSDARHIVGA
jgi:hypothetical protein